MRLYKWFEIMKWKLNQRIIINQLCLHRLHGVYQTVDRKQFPVSESGWCWSDKFEWHVSTHHHNPPLSLVNTIMWHKPSPLIGHCSCITMLTNISDIKYFVWPGVRQVSTLGLETVMDHFLDSAMILWYSRWVTWHWSYWIQNLVNGFIKCWW